jgi:ABC-type uncharacterized transport system substrate-binding protein
LVRAIRLRALPALIATALLGGSSVMNPPFVAAPSAASTARVVAWVDFDVEPVRLGVARLAELLRSQQFTDTRPVELRLVGADVANLARLKVDMARLTATRPALIVASSEDVAKSLLDLKTQIPIYFVIQSDPVRDGLVPSLVSTGSLTGYTYFVPLDEKIVELIGRVFPATKTIGVVVDPSWFERAYMSQDLLAKAKEAGLDVKIFDLHNQQELARLLQDPRAGQVQVWYVPYTEMAFEHGTDIAATLARSRAPTVYARRKFLKWGGLISVQSVDDDAMQVWAQTIANILNGVPAGSIPVMRPKEIEIAVNSSAMARMDLATRERIAREATVFEQFE